MRSALPELNPALSLLQEVEALVRLRVETLVPVEQPLVLISQVQRSGGTLLSQLLDGHPECHTHPHELQIGFPRPKDDWPSLDPSAHPAEWWEALRQTWPSRAFAGGFDKHAAVTDTGERQPFLLLPSLQRRLFFEVVSRRTVRRRRDMLDAFMTSFFNAWLDNANLYSPAKRWVTAFSAGLSTGAESRERFFADYPDGRLVCVLREPASWFVSARAYRDRYADVDKAMALWRASTHAMVVAKRTRPGAVLVLSFDELVRDTPTAIERVTSFLTIESHPSLHQPTFNGMPTRANSSFDVSRGGVIESPLHRRGQLSATERVTIDRLAGPAYEQARALLDD